MDNIYSYIWENIKRAELYEISPGLGKQKISLKNLEMILPEVIKTEEQAKEILNALQKKKYVYLQFEDDIVYLLKIKGEVK